MTALPVKTSISNTYPNPKNSVARAGFAQLWDAINETIEKPELELASATTCDIGGQLSTKLRITGTTTIASFGTNYRGPILLRMAGALTITHNSTTLLCPGSASITTASGDVLIAWPKSTTSGTADGWQVARIGTTALGIGQTWQNVAASRAASTTYTNSTGRSIMACVGLVTSATCSIAVTVGGITFAGSSYSTTGGINYASFIVPPGATYSVANNLGTSAVSTWAELR